MCALNICGVVFSGDRYCVEEIEDGGVRVMWWWDDPAYIPAGFRRAGAWYLYPPKIDPKLREYNPAMRNRRVYYAERKFADKLRSHGVSKREIESFGSCPVPSAERTSHGIWMSDGLYDLHQVIQGEHAWMEWTNGVPAEHLERDGRITERRII